MDERFRIKEVPMESLPPKAGKDRQVKIFKTVLASDALQHANPFWHRYFGSISAELETILDRLFTAAEKGLPLRPIFQRNHQSWENDELAQQVPMQVLADWFVAGSLEYVERFYRLPHGILAIGPRPRLSPHSTWALNRGQLPDDDHGVWMGTHKLAIGNRQRPTDWHSSAPTASTSAPQ